MKRAAQNIERLGWDREVYRRLCAAVDDALAASRSEAPVAVFDFDNTCILGDIGELFSHYLIDEMGYRYDLDAFWALVDERDGRKHIRGLCRSLLELPENERRDAAHYEEYLAEMGAIYARKYRREGAASCYEWAVRLHVGMSPTGIRRSTRKAIARELSREVAMESRTTRRGEQIRIARGIRIHREMRQLVNALESLGVEVWIVSASNQWSVEAFSALAFGVPRQRVLGNRVAADDDGILMDRTLDPVLYRQGKVAAIDEQIGRRPALVFGDAMTDFEMMCEATELAVLIDRGHPELRAQAEDRRWAVQPQDGLSCTREVRGL